MVLNKGEAHIFFLKLDCSDAAVTQSYLLLSAKQRQRADRFVVDKPRRCYIAAAARARELIAPYLGVHPTDVNYGYGEQGKPCLIGSDLQFNISHTEDRLALVIALDQPAGIDIEYHSGKLNVLELAQRFFHPDEYQQLCQISGDQQLACFYRLWTLKEAFIKATGKGLSFGLENFVVDIHAEAMNCLLSINSDFGVASDWSLGSLVSPWPDYAAAFSCKGKLELKTIFTKK